MLYKVHFSHAHNEYQTGTFYELSQDELEALEGASYTASQIPELEPPIPLAQEELPPPEPPVVSIAPASQDFGDLSDLIQ